MSLKSQLNDLYNAFLLTPLPEIKLTKAEREFWAYVESEDDLDWNKYKRLKQAAYDSLMI